MVVGFCFSFPIAQTSLNKGTLMKWVRALAGPAWLSAVLGVCGAAQQGGGLTHKKTLWGGKQPSSRAAAEPGGTTHKQHQTY